jgi:hypothetical protein
MAYIEFLGAKRRFFNWIKGKKIREEEWIRSIPVGSRPFVEKVRDLSFYGAAPHRPVFRVF